MAQHCWLSAGDRLDDKSTSLTLTQRHFLARPVAFISLYMFVAGPPWLLLAHVG